MTQRFCTLEAELLHGAIDPKIIAHRLAMLQAGPNKSACSLTSCCHRKVGGNEGEEGTEGSHLELQKARFRLGTVSMGDRASQTLGQARRSFP